MAEIVFKNIPEHYQQKLVRVFEIIKRGKEIEEISAEHLKEVLGELVITKFWWPTQQEQEDWLRRWNAMPVAERHIDLTLRTPWTFDSWIESLDDCELEFKNLMIDDQGSGQLVFEQLAMPSGGLEAIKELIKIFDGVIVSSDIQ